MFGSWIVGVYMRFDSNGVAQMTRLASSTRVANEQLLRQQGLIDSNTAAMMRYQRRMEEVRIGQLRIGTQFAGAASLAGIATIVEGLKEAGNLQRSMTGVNIATGFGAPEHLRSLVMHISSITAQNATTIANELAGVATSGINNPNRLASIFPLFAKAADVGFLGPKHLDPVTVVKQLTQFSHIFGIYQGKQLDQMVNTAMKLTNLQPEGIQPMLTQGRYFVGRGMSYGVSMPELFDQLMLMGQTGFLKGRGGSGIANIMTYLMGAESLTNHMTKVRRAAFMDLSHRGVSHGLGAMYDSTGHLKFVDEKGNLQLGKAITYLSQLRNFMTPGQFTNDLTNAFGKQGAAYATVVTRPEVQAQQARNRAALASAPSIDQMWQDYMANFMGQWSVFATNFKNVVIDVFTPELPRFTDLFRSMGNGLGRLGGVLSANPGLAKGIGDMILALTTLATVRFVVGIWQLSAAVAGFGRTVDLVKNKLLLDEGEIDAGLLGGVAKGKGGGIFGWLDNVLLGGLGGVLMRAGRGIMGFIGRFIAAPIEGLGPWIMRLGRSIGMVGAIGDSSILGGLGRLVVGIGGIGTLLGAAIGGLLRLAMGPIGAATTMLSGDSGPNPDRVYLSQRYGWLMNHADRASMRSMSAPVQRIIQAGRGAMFNASRNTGQPDLRRLLSAPTPTRGLEHARPGPHTTTVHVEHVSFDLPAGTSTEQGSAAAQHFLHLMGTFAPHPAVPNPMSVGGSNLVFGT